MSQPTWKGYLSLRRTAMTHVSLGICTVSPEPSLFAHTIYGTRGSFRQRAGDLGPIDDSACAFKGTQTTQPLGPFSHMTTQKLFITRSFTYVCLTLWALSRENLSSGFLTRWDSSRSVEMLDVASIGMILPRERTTKIRLRGCAGWSASLLFAHGIRQVFLWPGSYVKKVLIEVHAISSTQYLVIICLNYYVCNTIFILLNDQGNVAIYKFL